MGTHPIFESDFDCLTVYFQTPVGCEYEPREAESSAIVCPSRRQRYRPKEEEDRAQGVFYRRQEAPEPAQETLHQSHSRNRRSLTCSRMTDLFSTSRTPRFKHPPTQTPSQFPETLRSSRSRKCSPPS